MSSDIDSYIQQSRSQGVSDADISERLVSAGWNSDQVSRSLQTQSQIPVPSPIQLENTHSEVYDSFLSILMFISMGIYTSSLAVILHIFTDRWIPSTLGTSAYSTWGMSGMRYLLASLIVSFPFFGWLFYAVTKKRIISQKITSRSIYVTFTYITLAITFIFLLLKLISVVLAFIEGTSTLNSFVHVIVTAGISGLIFWYFSRLISHNKHGLTS